MQRQIKTCTQYGINFFIKQNKDNEITHEISAKPVYMPKPISCIKEFKRAYTGAASGSDAGAMV